MKDNKIRPDAGCRDSYIDFLRGFGLILLVIAHTQAPAWLANIRTFDVPLMVFISALCCKPLRGGYLAYCVKRFKRIYIPVFVFLTLFFIAEYVCHLMIGKPEIRLNSIIGSYLMLNSPSIGYVWIMRVFLMAALIIVPLSKLFRGLGFTVTVITLAAIVIAQYFIVMSIESIGNKHIRFIADEIIPYATGYSVFILLGLNIRKFSKLQVAVLTLVCATAVVGLSINYGEFEIQPFKYPPQSLYLVYGLCVSALLWILRPYLSWLGRYRFMKYLSANSMWIYLWHIIPVYAIGAIGSLQGNLMWPLRFLIVLTTSLLLTFAYSQLISRLPYRLSAVIK